MPALRSNDPFSSRESWRATQKDRERRRLGSSRLRKVDRANRRRIRQARSPIVFFLKTKPEHPKMARAGWLQGACEWRTSGVVSSPNHRIENHDVLRRELPRPPPFKSGEATPKIAEHLHQFPATDNRMASHHRNARVPPRIEANKILLLANRGSTGFINTKSRCWCGSSKLQLLADFKMRPIC